MSKFLCPLVWTFSNATSIKKIQTYQKNSTEISVQQLPVIIWRDIRQGKQLKTSLFCETNFWIKRNEQKCLWKLSAEFKYP